jgi:hypothetical protein
MRLPENTNTLKNFLEFALDWKCRYCLQNQKRKSVDKDLHPKFVVAV